MFHVEAWHPHAILAQEEGARLNFLSHNHIWPTRNSGRMGCTLGGSDTQGADWCVHKYINYQDCNRLSSIRLKSAWAVEGERTCRLLCFFFFFFLLLLLLLSWLLQYSLFLFVAFLCIELFTLFRTAGWRWRRHRESAGDCGPQNSIPIWVVGKMV